MGVAEGNFEEQLIRKKTQRYIAYLERIFSVYLQRTSVLRTYYVNGTGTFF